MYHITLCCALHSREYFCHTIFFLNFQERTRTRTIILASERLCSAEELLLHPKDQCVSFKAMFKECLMLKYFQSHRPNYMKNTVPARKYAF